MHTLIRLVKRKGDIRGWCRECGVQGCAAGEPALAGGDPAGGDQQHPVGGGDHALPHLRHEGHDCPLHRGPPFNLTLFTLFHLTFALCLVPFDLCPAKLSFQTREIECESCFNQVTMGCVDGLLYRIL